MVVPLALMQDIIRKTMGDELPDFYNIVLERPRDDPSGYDVIFIDAAAKVRCTEYPATASISWAPNTLANDSYFGLVI